MQTTSIEIWVCFTRWKSIGSRQSISLLHYTLMPHMLSLPGTYQQKCLPDFPRPVPRGRNPGCLRPTDLRSQSPKSAHWYLAPSRQSSARYYIMLVASTPPSSPLLTWSPRSKPTPPNIWLLPRSGSSSIALEIPTIASPSIHAK